MKLFYAIILGLMVLVSACAPQAEPEPVQPAPQPEVQPEPEPEVVEVVAPVEVEAPSSSEVRIIGQTGFEPDSLTISVGDSVTWINDGDKRAALIIFKDGKAYQNSPPVNSGGQFEYEFTETGTYDFWLNIAYGVVGGSIVVS